MGAKNLLYLLLRGLIPNVTMPSFKSISLSVHDKLYSPSVNPLFSYAPLENASNTRIVKLEPASGSQKVICSLKEITVAEGCHEYDALSYTWGESKKTKSINCNGKDVSITTHLYDVLHRLRRQDTTISLWIDQLCIDQSNIEERGAQVQLMGKIYKHAQKVLVWLGKENDDSKAAIKLVRKILHVGKRFPDTVFNRRNLESLGLPGWKSKEWKALQTFLGRLWFKRMWVIQEVIVSSRAVVMCGQESLLWEEMAEAIRRVEFTGPSPKSNVTFSQRWLSGDSVTYIESIRAGKFQDNKTNLLYLLINTRSREATDPRDKVFALLGLGHYRINADYSKSEYEVYLQLAVYHVSQILPGGNWRHLKDAEKAGWLSDLLLCAGFAHIQRLQSPLPSWVPDWSIGIDRQHSLGIGERLKKIPYCAGGNSLGTVQICHDTQLHLSGKLFDTVIMAGRVSLKLKDRMRVDKHHGLISSWFAESNLITNHCPQPYPTREPLNEVLKQTLIVNRTDTGEEASSEQANFAYMQLIRFIQGGPACMDFQPFHERHSQALQGIARGRVMILTQRGFLGLAPWGTMVGDTVCVLLGVPMPVILRPDFSFFQFVGECYLHGIMKGEVMQDESVSMQNIVLK